MSLLLDALQRASKDKERVALAAANVTSTDVLAGPPTQPSDELELELTPKPIDVVVVPPKATVTMENPPLEPAPEPVTLPPPVAPQPPVVPPRAEAPAPKAPPTETPTTSTASRPNALRNEQTNTRPIVPANAQAAANAIHKAYARPPSTNTAHRRALVLGGVAAVIALGLGSFMLGLWGDPARLMGLTGSSPLASASVPETMPAPASVVLTASAPLSAPVEVVPETPVPTSAPASAPSAQVALVATHPDKQAKQTIGSSVPPAPRSPIFSSKVTNQSHLEQGYAALIRGSLDDAAQAYNAALATNPLETDALLGLAYIAHSKGRREEAQALYSKVLRLDPSNSVANAGLIALDAGTNANGSTSGTTKGDRAKAFATSQPDSAAAQALSGSALAQEGFVAEATLAFARAQALEPGNPWHSYNLAVALDKLGNYAQATEQYNKALQNANHSPSPLGAQRIASVRLRVAQLQQLLDPESDTAR